MKRYRQTLDEILEQLSPVDSSWRDEHAEMVIQRLAQVPTKTSYARDDLMQLLDTEHPPEGVKPRVHFEAGLTAIRLFMDLSKDEFSAALRDRLGGSLGMTRAKQNPDEVCAALEHMGILERMALTVNTPVAWSDLLTERLKGGRGSAIKGQRRGRHLEDFVEALVIQVFGETAYDARCPKAAERRTRTVRAAERIEYAILP